MFWNGITASDGLSGSGGTPSDGSVAALARHRRGEAIAASWHRLDATPVCAPLIKDPAKRCDLNVQVAVFTDPRQSA